MMPLPGDTAQIMLAMMSSAHQNDSQIHFMSTPNGLVGFTSMAFAGPGKNSLNNEIQIVFVTRKISSTSEAQFYYL